MSELCRVLMRRDELTYDEAMEQISEARTLVANGADPEEILYEEFGLEPDYIFDLL